ncbi:hypothetical protein CCR75_003877 [Bremia lactucae]|uniref:C2 domain-containing protein n=1 Tax=Bremia lactucae TaxID=4779 RepID=A0A976IHT8_BRELC|nr:hypothetical protein CCR75_003877 [Bremia lactucae]
MTRKNKQQQLEATQTLPAVKASSHTSSTSSDSAPEVADTAASLHPPLELKLSSPLNPASKMSSSNQSPGIQKKVADIMNGTIHIKVLSARNLPTMDFGKRQDPVVLVQLDDSVPKSWAITDPAFRGGSNPEWTERNNNELELFYDANLFRDKAATLTFEVYSDESGDTLIGSGRFDANSVLNIQSGDRKTSTIHLNEPSRTTSNRGELDVEMWFGPPVRKAFRAAGRAYKLLEARDTFVNTLRSVISTVFVAISNLFQRPKEFARKHRKLSATLTGLLGLMAAGALAVFVVVAVPTTLVAFFTFPFWIIPFLTTSFFTAPLWVPIFLLIGLFLLVVATFVFGLGITSNVVRRKCAFILNKIKHSDVGKRVIYEKSL